ncbi:uncharacterized protein LOC110033574 [Phalaenopsis equestris]|uniref:uncharacterized protein LOC110033574 n=1 Tax=Phalaenopsis equestris TaxID=78828 RepID=UPI0009E2F337|nr:uncharacterized protein LOC110033574 [Phalaenopsis equestris]
MGFGESLWIRSRRRRCVLISLLIFLFFVLLFIILGVTVFRVREATTTVNSVRLGGFKAGFSIPNLSVDLNVTLDIDLTAYNPNHASFRYGDGTAELFYQDSQVGEAAIPSGEIDSGGSERMNVSVTIFAGRLIGDSSVYKDVLSGSMLFQTTTRIPGRVTVLGIFKKHVVTYSKCDVIVNVTNRTSQTSNCKYRAKL